MLDEEGTCETPQYRKSPDHPEFEVLPSERSSSAHPTGFQLGLDQGTRMAM